GGVSNGHTVDRFADVLLIYADAAVRAEGQVSPLALESLNQVRRRAYGYNPTAPSGVDYQSPGSTEQFVDLVVKERGYEFLDEGKRWHELRRIGRVNELIGYGKNKTVAEKHLLWPIPLSEMNYNNLLDPATDQNPGY